MQSGRPEGQVVKDKMMRVERGEHSGKSVAEICGGKQRGGRSGVGPWNGMQIKVIVLTTDRHTIYSNSYANYTRFAVWLG